MNTLLFSTASYNYLKQDILDHSNFEAGILFEKEFPDGERYHQIRSEIKDKHIILLGGTIDDANTLELYDVANGIVQGGARSLQIVIPYFGYATMERAVQKGEIVKAKNRALLLSSIPMCAETNKIYLMDLHAEGIPYYFESNVRTKHIYCKNIIINACRAEYGSNFVLAATDAGRAKWVESLANEMGVGSAFVYKQRLSGGETKITGVNADVKGKQVIIYDDMIRTGGSLMQAAEAYKAQGAINIIAITTHGLFTSNALQKMEAQQIIQKVICTNTHPESLVQKSKLIEIKSVASSIFEALN